jgi:antitoxin VapB
MALNIKDPAIHALARELAQATGESLTQAVRALQERLRRVQTQQVTPLQSLVETLDDIALRCAALPDLDRRSPDDILGYDAQGLPPGPCSREADCIGQC